MRVFTSRPASHGRGRCHRRRLARGARRAGPYGFEREIAGIDGDRMFVDCSADYAPNDELPDGRVYRNLWVVDLAEDGRARSFTEWCMKQPRD